MHTNRTEMCCGIGEVIDLGIGKITDLPDRLKRVIQDHTRPKDWDEDYYDYDDPEAHYGLLQCVLSQEQWYVYEKLVLQSGFIFRVEFNNPKTDNNCRLYTYTINRKKTKRD